MLSRHTRKQLARLLLWLVCSAHILYTPYTKVEESWTLHTIHDIHHYGLTREALAQYDHVEHPCPVPRSFVGPLALSALAWWPVRYLAPLLAPWYGHKLAEQIVVRLCLATVNALVLRSLEPTALLLTALQFHLPFWMGRPLPNMLAFPLAHWSFSRLHQRKSRASDASALVVLALAAAVCRVELVAFLLPLGLMFLWRHGLAVSLLANIAFALALGIGFAVAIDSYFWDQPFFWPEAISLIFNVYHGKSEAWGVEPWHFYFTRHLPKMMLGAYPFAWLSALGLGWAQATVVPMVSAVAIASKLKHKEWRFVVYAVPSLNAGALDSLRAFLLGRPKLRWLATAGIFGSTFAATAFTTYISHHNYPGGDAMKLLHQSYPLDSPLHVHVDAYSAMTGASLYTYQNADNWIYNRTETLLEPSDYEGFDVLVTHDPAFHARCFRTVAQATGYAGLGLHKDLKAAVTSRQIPITLRWQPLVMVAQRREEC